MIRRLVTPLLGGVLCALIMFAGTQAHANAPTCFGYCQDSVYDEVLDYTFTFAGCKIYGNPGGVKIAMCYYD